MPTATTATRARVSLAPLPSLEDADLVLRARHGDDLAFEEIVRRYRAPLIRYSARQVGRDHAEDVTQHTLASAAAHLRDDPRPIHLRAWLYRVAHNAAINMRQRKDWGHEELSNDIDGVPQPPDVAAQRTAVREVVSELDRLPDRQRTALLMSVFEGMGYDEIASRLETSPNSVRALLSRARVHLRKTAAAIAPLPLLQSLVRKVSGGVAGASGSQGTIAAGGTVIQAKLVAVAATTVVAGAATAERAVMHNDTPVTADQASSAPAIVPHTAAPRPAPLDVDATLPKSSPPPADRAPQPPPAPPASGSEPVAEVPPPPPAVEPPPAEPPSVAEQPPAADQPPAEEPAPAADPGKDEAPPAGDLPVEEGSASGGADDPPPDGYTPDPPDGYTPTP